LKRARGQFAASATPPKDRLSAVDSFLGQSHGCVWSVQTMQVETKFLRLCQPAALGEQIDGWKVYWVGGWGRDRLFFYVMVARGEEQYLKPAFAES
jgi:hypothetical protein